MSDEKDNTAFFRKCLGLETTEIVGQPESAGELEKPESAGESAWVEAALKHYPQNWAFDATNPALVIANIVSSATAEANNKTGEVETLFSATMSEIHDMAEGALGYPQVCDAITAVRRLAQGYKAEQGKADKAEARATAALGEREVMERRLIEATRQAEVSYSNAKIIAERLLESTEANEKAEEEICNLKSALNASNARADIWEKNYANAELEVMAERVEVAEELIRKLNGDLSVADATIGDVKAQMAEWKAVAAAENTKLLRQREAAEAERDRFKAALESVTDECEPLEDLTGSDTHLSAEEVHTWTYLTIKKIGLMAQSALRADAAPTSPWRPIETAPKDGSAILLLSAAYADKQNGTHPAKAAIGHWNPEGESWVDERGRLDGEAYTLAVTGTWWSGGGWFQPDEVTHWMPLPNAALNPDAAQEGK